MKFKVYLEYVGANYSGWQKQPNESSVKTVQGTLIKAIEAVFKKTKGVNKLIDLQGSGRTDAGVHALCQIAHLEAETMLAPEILKMKLNDELPSDINILEMEKAPREFHARHSAKARQYLYVISKRRTAFDKRYVWWVKDRLETLKMNNASKIFLGKHDFRNFSDRVPDDKSTNTKILLLELTSSEDKIFIRIKATHFLWKMVRRIVGTLVEVGRGNVEEKEIHSLLTGKKADFDPAKYTAPPSGLFLEKVEY